ncbi:hypothetical protein Tdes44962_MAKER02575 [Teratosphaeria destructans]|uniref:Uncharacterized protein n=1 Tax=Teratosphaeria destructans TaxID=418781 RepID=A0A9W7W329_9PEZI|nr:hypothetical protein Tdes44962_MAKER02575 [Teratosphaeria destructans]
MKIATLLAFATTASALKWWRKCQCQVNGNLQLGVTGKVCGMYGADATMNFGTAYVGRTDDAGWCVGHFMDTSTWDLACPEHGAPEFNCVEGGK